MMNSILKNEAGMTLPEILIGLAITGVVSVFAMNLLVDFNRRAWESETKASANADVEAASALIKKNLPFFVQSVSDPTGNDPYGSTQPDSSNWTCSGSSCTWKCYAGIKTYCEMSLSYSYKDINGTNYSDTLTPIHAECYDPIDSIFGQPAVGLNTKAVDSTLGSACLTCPAGKAPQLRVAYYTFDATTGAPTEATRVFPQSVGMMSRQGVLAMGACFNIDGYTYNDGTASAAANITRYDRWKITLIPVYTSMAPSASQTASQINQALRASSEKILITRPSRFGPGFRFTPTQ